MTKQELIDRIYKAQAGDIPKKTIQQVVDASFGEIAKSFKKDDRFSFPQFGTFTKKKRSARKGRNPQTGEEISIPARITVTFKPAQAFRDILAEKK
jgi:DNA-binding protein HU-beta